MAELAYSVVLPDGSVAVKGTEETPELRKEITFPAAWGEESDSADSAHGGKGTATRGNTGKK